MLNPKTKLSELSDYELALLLNTTVAEARKEREFFREALDGNPFAIMDWTIEEFHQDYARGEFSRTRMIAGDVPRNVGLRFRQLQELLRRHFEFEARFPAAYEILFPREARRRDRAGLFLPSFGIHVLNSYPFYTMHSQGTAWAGDAYTFTDNRRKRHPWGKKVERRLRYPDFEDLRGILLAMLCREEVDERISYMVPFPRLELFENVKPPEPAYVRLTDLRLARQIKPGSLKRGLEPILALLERPITRNSVLEWKLRTLGSRLEKPERFGREQWIKAAKDLGMEDECYIGPEQPPEETVSRTGNGALPVSNEDFEPILAQTELLERQFGDEESGIVAISFSAAALLLFVDLDSLGLMDASSRRVAEHVESLASVVRDLIENLNRATVRLETITANRPAGRQREIEGNDYTALCKYRMGCGLRETAEWLEITPYSSKTGRGTRDWKARVKRRLRNGKRIEDERYPRAAAIFAHRDNPHVRRKARRAYRKYLVEKGRSGDLFRFAGFGHFIRTGSAQTQRSFEVTYAYVQLGSCIMQNIPPIP
jgi:hypothetical protein